MGNKLLFLGTCAADFSPRLAKLKGKFDRDARRASCALVDGKYLIDCGPHCAESFAIAGKDPCAVTDIFMTHLHDDHFDPENVGRIAAGHKEPVRLWVRADSDVPDIKNVAVRRMENLKEYSPDGAITVAAVPANHDESSFPRHLVFRLGGKKMFYGVDGSWITSGEFLYMRGMGLDLAVLDGTCGDYEGEIRFSEHNSIPMIRLMLPSLAKACIIDQHTEI